MRNETPHFDSLEYLLRQFLFWYIIEYEIDVLLYKVDGKRKSITNAESMEQHKAQLYQA